MIALLVKERPDGEWAWRGWHKTDTDAKLEVSILVLRGFPDAQAVLIDPDGLTDPRNGCGCD